MKNLSILEVNGTAYDLSRKTWIMGVLNVTPDSFSDGGLYLDTERAVDRGLEIASQGADILDVGGESTRPGSDAVSVEEEKRRVVPVIAELRKQTDVLISVDTTKSEVAQAALDAGADMINDISALRFDDRMPGLAASRGVPVVLMHMQGTPKTMQVDPKYKDLIGEVKSFLSQRINAALEAGIGREKIIIDPGIGFGKSVRDNLALIRSLSAFGELGRPILIGVSRKSFIGRILDVPPDDRLEGTIASAVLGLLNGARILRIHDVGAVARAVRMAEAILSDLPPAPAASETRSPDAV